MSMKEVVTTFGNAKIVGGPSGSGWNNVVYSPGLETTITLFEQNINQDFTYVSPSRVTRFLTKDCWALTDVLKPIYDIGSNNYVWFSTPTLADTDLLRKQLSTILNENPAPIHAVGAPLNDKQRCCILGTIAESLAWYQLFDDSRFFLALAERFNSDQTRLLWDGPLQQIKNSHKAKESVGPEGLGIVFNHYPELIDDIRDFAEDEDYLDRYAAIQDYMALLLPRLAPGSALIAEGLDTAATVAAEYCEVDRSPKQGANYDLVVIDGSNGYKATRQSLQAVQNHISKETVVMCSPCFLQQRISPADVPRPQAIFLFPQSGSIRHMETGIRHQQKLP